MKLTAKKISNSSFSVSYCKIDFSSQLQLMMIEFCLFATWRCELFNFLIAYLMIKKILFYRISQLRLALRSQCRIRAAEKGLNQFWSWAVPVAAVVLFLLLRNDQHQNAFRKFFFGVLINEAIKATEKAELKSAIKEIVKLLLESLSVFSPA